MIVFHKIKLYLKMFFRTNILVISNIYYMINNKDNINIIEYKSYYLDRYNNILRLRLDKSHFT
mgnify:CR=1 FL=1